MITEDYISGIRKELLSIEDNAKNIDGLTESQWTAIRAAHRLLGEYSDKLLHSLDTIESEKPMNQDELEKELDRYLHGEFQQTAGGNFNNYIQVARHFAKWGARYRDLTKSGQVTQCVLSEPGQKLVPQELKVASVQIADNLLSKPRDCALASKADYWNGARDGVIAGAKWQKDQMMQEATEGRVRKDSTIGYFEFSNEQQFRSLLEQFQDCDKVRIIVIKEN
jgi:hypothetical protein